MVFPFELDACFAGVAMAVEMGGRTGVGAGGEGGASAEVGTGAGKDIGIGDRTIVGIDIGAGVCVGGSLRLRFGVDRAVTAIGDLGPGSFSFRFFLTGVT